MRVIAARAGMDLLRALVVDMRVVTGILRVRMIVMIAMDGMLDMLGFDPARLAVEGQE
jgi:hypothetical protein